jgi:hypothetical protein
MIRHSGHGSLAFIRFDFILEHAGEQARRGFPILFAHAVTATTAAIEVAVHDFVKVWLRDYPPSLQRESVSQLMLPAGELLGKSRRALLDAVFSTLEMRLRSSGSGQRVKPGVEPYLRLLTAVGIPVKLSPDIVASTNELVAVRNQIVHHGGRVTPRFVELCPRFERLRKIKVNAKMWAIYHTAASEFLDEVQRAAVAVAGLDIEV